MVRRRCPLPGAFEGPPGLAVLLAEIATKEALLVEPVMGEPVPGARLVAVGDSQKGNDLAFFWSPCKFKNLLPL